MRMFFLISLGTENYVRKYDVLSSIKKNGTFVLNTKRFGERERERYKEREKVIEEEGERVHKIHVVLF